MYFLNNPAGNDSDRKVVRGLEKALSVAKYVVARCFEDGKPVNNISLNKILYLIQEECQRRFGEACFTEDMEAWDFGPVVPKVYYYFCGRGAGKLDTHYDVKIRDKAVKFVIDEIIKENEGGMPWDYTKKIERKNGPYDMAVRAGKKAVILFEERRAHRGKIFEKLLERLLMK